MANVALHRDKIVQATIRLFREKGYATTGLSEILKLSGAPKGSLYHYFPGGKEELAVEAIATAGKVVEKTLDNLLQQTTSAAEFVKAYCDLLAGWMESSGFKSGCPITTTILETVPHSTALTTVSRSVLQRWVDVTAQVFIRDGLSKDNAVADAEFMIAAIEGALIQTRVQQSSQPLLNVSRRFKSL